MEIVALLSEIEAYCRAEGLAETTFGKRALGDPAFVGRLRNGRSPTLRTVERVRRYIASKNEANNV